MMALTVSEALARVAEALPDEALVLERALNQQTVELTALRNEVAELSFYGKAMRPGAERIVGEIGMLEEAGDGDEYRA
jgi:hypothetical protein